MAVTSVHQREIVEVSFRFLDGIDRIHPALDIETLPTFRGLMEIYGLFKQVKLDTSRTCVYRNDEIDLASDNIYEYGKVS